MEEREHIDELAAPYVLGALEPEEVEAVELHLLRCDACRALVEEERRVVALLPYLAEPRPVPLRARRRLLARFREEHEAPAPARRRIVPQLTRLGWVAAALAAAFAAVFAWNSSQMQEQVAKKEAEVSVLDEQQRAIAAFVQSQRGFVTQLRSTGALPGSAGGVILDPTRNAALLMVDGMPRPATGHAYVVWLVKGDRHVNVGVLPVDDEGRGMLYITAPEALVSFDSILVTEEAGPQVANPNGIRLLAAQVSD